MNEAEKHLEAYLATQRKLSEAERQSALLREELQEQLILLHRSQCAEEKACPTCGHDHETHRRMEFLGGWYPGCERCGKQQEHVYSEVAANVWLQDSGGRSGKKIRLCNPCLSRLWDLPAQTKE
jgi:hypothetical protein